MKPMRFWVGLLSLLCVSTLTVVLPQGCAVQSPQPAVERPVFGMWVWRPRWIARAEQQDELIDFCVKQGINRLLIQVHFKKDVVETAPAVLRFQDEMKRFLAHAWEAGIAVEALDGEPAMALAENHPYTIRRLEAILEFNRTLPVDGRFTGLHLDIEPYTLKQWDSPDRQQIMYQYLELHEDIRSRLRRQSPPMHLAVSIPFWYDLKSGPEDSCELEFRGKTKNFHQHIQDLTDYVAIMSYRNWAEGDNSITSHSRNEIKYAGQIGRFACAGLETIRLPETPEVSFYGMRPTEFWAEAGKVRQTLAEDPGYGGLFVHDYDGFRRLLRDQLSAAYSLER